MILLTVLIAQTLQIFTPQAHGAQSQCSRDLRAVVSAARAKVESSMKPQDGCRVGAIQGGAAGTQAGCSSTLGLKLMLSTYYYRAKDICGTVCKAEGKQTQCEALITTDNMVRLGLQGLGQQVSRVSFRSGPASELRFEEFENYNDFLDFALDIKENQNSSPNISI